MKKQRTTQGNTGRLLAAVIVGALLFWFLFVATAP